MLKKVLSSLLVGFLFSIGCFSQTASAPIAESPSQKRLSRADFVNSAPLIIDFEKESYKLPKKKNNLSGGAKTALWVGLIAAGVATVVILATTSGGDKEETRSPCLGTAQVGVPCPPGCVCIQ